MRPLQLLSLIITFSLGFALGCDQSIAQPTIGENTVLQICQAFSNNAPEQMPPIVSSEAIKKFIETYSTIYKSCTAVCRPSWPGALLRA
jgi:hypothetical protein